MTVTYEQPKKCPKCGQIMDYFTTFSTYGAQCRFCGYKEEVNTISTYSVITNNKESKDTCKDCPNNNGRSACGCTKKSMTY